MKSPLIKKDRRRFLSENRIQHKDGNVSLGAQQRCRDTRCVRENYPHGRIADRHYRREGRRCVDAGLPNRLLFIDRLGRLIEHNETAQRLSVCSYVPGPRWLQDDQ